MCRIKIILIIYFLFANAYADNNSIKLTCEVHFSNFNSVKQASTGAEVTISGMKHHPAGAVLVTQTNDYEFWVMSHGQQTINNRKFLTNYQVAIKDKKTDMFMHSLSDTTHSPDRKPIMARVSLVQYEPGSFIEKGELFFECRTVDKQ